MVRIALAGNATWLNRGCEAIELSTRALLSSVFDDPTFAVLPFSSGDSREAETGSDDVDRHTPPDFSIPKWSVDRLRWAMHRKLGTGREYRAIVGSFVRSIDAMGSCDVLLSIGGDNYTSDYGRPSRFWALNEAWITRHVPVVLWGASVGPFEQGRDESVARECLSRVSAVFARESLTVDYLDSLGLQEKVVRVADPAFTLLPIEPAGITWTIDPKPLGVNLSPLFGRYTGLGEDEWFEVAVSAVDEVSKRTGRGVLLVPHVLMQGQNDWEFLQRVAIRLGSDRDIAVLPPALGAQELKHCIGRCSAFAGARTHATIASMSSMVPTVSLGYSRKAEGINRDVFGHVDHVLPASHFAPAALAEMIQRAMVDETERKRLEQGVKLQVENARSAGLRLRDLLADRLTSGRTHG